MKLLKVFQDINPIIRGMSGQRHYTAYFKLVPLQRTPLTVQELEEYVRRLQEKYPDKGFHLQKRKVNSKLYYVITKKKYITIDGRKVRQYDRCPIYIDVETNSIYIPEYYYRIKPKLCNYILMRTLGTLKLATVKNIGGGYVN